MNPRTTPQYTVQIPQIEKKTPIRHDHVQKQQSTTLSTNKRVKNKRESRTPNAIAFVLISWFWTGFSDVGRLEMPHSAW